MSGFTIWATMQARPGREADAKAFLEESHRRIAADEPGTTSFHAIDLGEGGFAIFNTFADEAAIAEHVEGPIAAWVMEMNAELFTGPYDITRGVLFAHKPFAAAPAREKV